MNPYHSAAFSSFGNSIGVAATTASTANALPRAKDQTVIVTNAVGNGTLFALLGASSTIVATSLACVPITAGSQRTLHALEAQTHIAIALSSGTGNAWVTVGDGSIF